MLGFIGVGGMGTGLLNIFKGFPDVRVAAVCDVYEPHARRAQSAADGKPEVYHDFRKLLDRKDLDAVVIATPDHWHAIPTILACQAGKDVYCEKPLTHRIAEGRAVVNAAEKYKRVTQMGNLIHAGENYHRVVEIVRSGVLGTISKTRVWMAADRSGLGKPADGDPPAGCDYDFWLGPAPKRAVQPEPVHLQLAVVLGLRRRPADRLLLPHRRSCPLGHGGGRAPDHHRDRRAVSPSPTTARRPTRSRWPTSTRRTARTSSWSGAIPTPTPTASRTWGWASCSRGPRRRSSPTTRPTRSSPRRARTIAEPPRTLPRSVGHHREWLNAIKTRAQCSCNFAYGHRLSSVGHLGNIALWTGEKLKWDAAAERITNHPEANRFLTKEYRKPWALPEV